MSLFKKLRQKLNYLPPEQVDLIHKAFECAHAAHAPQKRKSGEPYIIHPVAVAKILAELKLDHQTIMAGLLHDVLEDTPVSKEDMAGPSGGYEPFYPWKCGLAIITQDNEASQMNEDVDVDRMYCANTPLLLIISVCT